MKCASCGKGAQHGHNVSHSKRRTNRVFKPNLHESRVWVGSGYKKLKLCTKCLRMYRMVEKAMKQAVTTKDAPAAASA
jgi:large subunit ribosomal protein L28